MFSSFQLVPDDKIDSLLEICKKGSYNDIQKSLDDLLLDGYPGAQVFL